MKQKQPWIAFLRFSLLFLFITYYGSITLFPHEHYIDGVKIVHSHPFSKAGQDTQDNHSHSKSEVVLIKILTSFLITWSLLLFVFEAFRRLDFKRFLPKEQEGFHGLLFSGSNGLRAPPIQ